MKIIEFRFINTDDLSDIKYEWCSRVYEYPILLNFLNEIKPSSVHNTSAGYGIDLGIRQLQIIKELKKYNTIHSDLHPTESMNIKQFNIVNDKMLQHEVVINISVLEHLPKHEQILVLDNLWKNVKDGGYLFLTFDYPRVNLEIIEKWVGSKCQSKPDNAVNGINSVFVQPKYSDLNFILLILNKNI